MNSSKDGGDWPSQTQQLALLAQLSPKSLNAVCPRISLDGTASFAIGYVALVSGVGIHSKACDAEKRLT
jgi:hypothetical protein